MSNGFWRAMTTQHWAGDVVCFRGLPRGCGQARVFRPSPRRAVRRHPSSRGSRCAWTFLIVRPGVILSKRALEPNPFLEPDFAQSAILHLPAAQRPGNGCSSGRARVSTRAAAIGAVALESGGSRLVPGVGRKRRHLATALSERRLLTNSPERGRSIPCSAGCAAGGHGSPRCCSNRSCVMGRCTIC